MILIEKIVLTSNRSATPNGSGETLLRSLDKILTDCLQFPSAIALDFRFMGQDIEKMTQISATDVLEDDELQTSSLCQESPGPRFGLSVKWTVLQRNILDIVAKLSHHSPEKIEQQTSFFHLGLDSINAAQIAASLRQKGWDVSPIEVIEVSFFDRHEMAQN